ncbi:MAG: hypothetical protein ACSHWU_07095 [Marinicella sp.]
MKKYQVILWVLMLMPALCLAEEKAPTLLSDSWTITPKADHVADFEAAFKEHLAMRTEKGDTRHWDTYVAVTGDKLNSYIVRSCCKPWAEQDTYSKWSQETLGNHFNETVNPFVESYAHNFTVIDTENSNWGDDVKANFVGVTYFATKVGKGKKMGEAIAEMSTVAKDNGWPRSWSWFYPVGGTGGVGLATPFENFADMAPMEESFYAFTKKHLKSEKKADKLFEKFNSTFSSAEYVIYRHRKDMSMAHDEE